jgi:anaerobic magnesium-protoporphyrin IX monomethyl ester cyclase
VTGRALDLLLVNPGARRQIYQALGGTLSAIETPVWTALLATFARKRGFSVEIVDAHAQDLTPEEAAKRVADAAPRLAAIVAYGHQPSASTQVMPAAGAICTAVKQTVPDVPVLLVGGHVAALPERTLREEAADFVCGGEGPYTVVDLLEALKSPHPDLDKVRGLWYRSSGDVCTTPPAPLVGNLDQEMPGMAWDLLPMDVYRAHNWHCFGDLKRQPYASLYTTLGCPYHCSFCCIQAPFKSGEHALGYKEAVNSYRFWNPRTTVDQIGRLVSEYGVRNIKFADEMFVLNMRHVHGICDLLIERGYDLNIWAYARIDTVKHDETVEKLRRAGFNWLCFGIEAGSERVRADANKRFDEDEIYRTVARVRAAGINVLGNYIFGLPEDDLETMRETLDLALDLNCEFSNFYSALAYPGSPLYQTALQNGWPLPESWSGYSQHSRDTLPLPTKHISGLEVLRFRDRAFQIYFSSPRYLDMIERKFGRATVDHIREMASFTLERPYTQTASSV